MKIRDLNLKFSDQRTWRGIGRQLVRARFADVAAFRLAAAKPWNLSLVWRALKFRWKNQRRRKVLVEMHRRHMGMDWRCSLPRKKQRALGYLPKIQNS